MSSKVYIIVTILMAISFLYLSFVNLVREKKIKKKYTTEAVILLFKFLIYYPFVRLPFCIAKYKDLFNISECYEDGTLKSRKVLMLEVLKKWIVILKNINKFNDSYVERYQALTKSLIKSKEENNKLVGSMKKKNHKITKVRCSFSVARYTSNLLYGMSRICS